MKTSPNVKLTAYIESGVEQTMKVYFGLVEL